MHILSQYLMKSLKFQQRNKGLRITEPSWRVTDGLGDRLLFQCAEPEGKDRVGDEMEQSTHCRVVLQSSILSPKVSAEGQREKMIDLTEGRITEDVRKPRLLNLWPMVLGRHEVQLERVNPNPSHTHSA
ncbi:hypothetical protein H5410_060572 [Solanum commersonii]|uniref:Uncharacterized protein n=1 Tax=Solanum commersonii TaxID=4109 RepID=A0A9J5W6Z3_SOLCO|nr:hypothetical protein H5410_060572 [Solanum commersonii]